MRSIACTQPDVTDFHQGQEMGALDDFIYRLNTFHKDISSSFIETIGRLGKYHRACNLRKLLENPYFKLKASYPTSYPALSSGSQRPKKSLCNSLRAGWAKVMQGLGALPGLFEGTY